VIRVSKFCLAFVAAAFVVYSAPWWLHVAVIAMWPKIPRVGNVALVALLYVAVPVAFVSLLANAWQKRPAQIQLLGALCGATIAAIGTILWAALAGPA